MANILEKAAPGAKKTWLLYNANLSYSQHQRYLRSLVKLRLLAEKKGLYITTEKGHAFLKSYRTLVDLLGEEGSSKNSDTKRLTGELVSESP